MTKLGLVYSHVCYDEYGLIKHWLIDGHHVVDEPCYPLMPQFEVSPAILGYEYLPITGSVNYD